MKAHTSITSAARLAAVAILGAASLLFTGCFYVPGVSGANARAGLVLPRYIAANTSSLALIVGGPGMDTITVQYPVGTTSATLSVPAGVARTFTLLANTPSVTLKGDTTADLLPGETKEIVLTPTMFASQIIVPDYTNNRLVQVSDMSGTGWTTLAGRYPHDVDFDDQGRVYVANNDGVSDGVTRMDDISGANLSGITGVTGIYVQSIAMDRTNGMLYYVYYDSNLPGNALYRVKVTPTLGTPERIYLETISVNSAPLAISNITGIAVDPDGSIYVANNQYSIPAAIILKINPNPALAPTLLATSSYAFSNPWDILVNGGFVYVSDSVALQIVRLSRDLQFVDSFSGPSGDPFHGPERFVAILNKPITVADEVPYAPGDRIVAFNDMTGAGWTTYGSSGSGQDQFELFYNSIGS